MRRLYISGCMIMVALLLIMIFYFATARDKSDFRCSSYIRMDLALSASQDIVIDTVINFQRKNGSAVILLEGRTETGGNTTTLSREIRLKANVQDGERDYSYAITQTLPGPTDTTPESIFNDILSEMSGDSRHLYLREQAHRKEAVLFAGPYSDLFMCVKG